MSRSGTLLEVRGGSERGVQQWTVVQRWSREIATAANGDEMRSRSAVLALGCWCDRITRSLLSTLVALDSRRVSLSRCLQVCPMQLTASYLTAQTAIVTE